MATSFFFLVCEIKIFAVSKEGVSISLSSMSIRTRSHSQDVDNILKNPASLPVSFLSLNILHIERDLSPGNGKINNKRNETICFTSMTSTGNIT